MSQAAFGKDCCGGRARGEGGVHGCAQTRTWEEEGSGADPDLGRAGGPLHLCGCGGSWGGRGVPLAAALRRTADGGPGGRNLGGGSGGGLVLGRAGGPVRLRVCAARGGGRGSQTISRRSAMDRVRAGRDVRIMMGAGREGGGARACMDLQCCGFARRLRVWPGGSQH